MEISAERGRPSAEHPPSGLSERHFVEFIPPTKKKTNPTRQCIVHCSKRDRKLDSAVQMAMLRYVQYRVVTNLYGTLSLILLGVFGDCKFVYISNQL
ncbi:hypothetical protein TNCV_2578841 [Trichonephila clavipes]|nr:hypothetical protein TNCV_2578841 [Trichonephila clavipes]